MAESGQESVGSMGDDTPMAVLSQKVRPFYDFFRQQFAQVTNPPIDPLREAIVMSLETCLGRELSVFAETAEHAERVILSSPVLTPAKFRKLLEVDSKRINPKPSSCITTQMRRRSSKPSTTWLKRPLWPLKRVISPWC